MQEQWPAYERLNILTGGKRCPIEFWEWMFGLPIGWTDSISPLNASYPSWLRMLGFN